MYVFQSHIHIANRYTKFFETRQQIEEMMWSQCQLRRLECLRCEVQVRHGERSSERGGRGRGRRGAGGDDSAARVRSVAMSGCLPLKLEGIGEGFLMRADEVGKILYKAGVSRCNPLCRGCRKLFYGGLVPPAWRTFMKECPSSESIFRCAEGRRVAMTLGFVSVRMWRESSVVEY